MFQPFIFDCSFSHRNKQEPEQINVQIKTKAMEYKGTTKKESDFDQYWSIHFSVLFKSIDWSIRQEEEPDEIGKGHVDRPTCPEGKQLEHCCQGFCMLI